MGHFSFLCVLEVQFVLNRTLGAITIAFSGVMLAFEGNYA